MSKSNSSAASTSDDVAQASRQTKDAANRGRINISMVQDILLIWLDSNMDENNADCRDTITQLRRVVYNVNIFTDRDQCIDFLTNIERENVCMVISGALSQYIIPLIHDVIQLHSIFIFCGNKNYHEQWTKIWSKVQGIFIEISSICECLKQVVHECEQNSISISLLTTDGGVKKNLDQLDPSFMYMQLMKETLLDIDFEQKHFEEYVKYCREVFSENDRELENIRKFERQYRDETPVWWYTLQCFLYPMLNRSLRLMDVDIIIKMGFFIQDLHNHIKELHNQQFNHMYSSQKFVVYRGQGMSQTEFEHLTETKGGLISFNNFLSTSKDQEIALRFANRVLTNSALISVLFIITIDPSQSTTPFASIKDVSYYNGEDEVLFAMQTVFRIGDISSVDRNPRLFQVRLTLTDNDDEDLRQLTDYIRKETFPNLKGWYRLGAILYKMGQFDKSEEVCQILVEQRASQDEKEALYNMLGRCKYERGEYREAIVSYEKLLEIQQQSLPSNHPHLAGSYNNIGLMYSDMGEYSKALLYHEKALAIRQQSLPADHPDLASSYTNIGLLYTSMSEYSKALSYHGKALEIEQQSLPPNHPDLAASYNNIGLVYFKMSEYSKALSHYKKSLAIKQQSLPPNHPRLTQSYDSIGLMYFDMNEYRQALSYYEKSLATRQESLPPNHPDLAFSYNSIGFVYSRMSEHSKALSYQEKSLAIRQQALPPNHPDLVSSYKYIGAVYFDISEYSKALSYYENALEIEQQSLPTNHSDLAFSYNSIGLVYLRMSEYSKALLYYEKALVIRQQSLPANQSDLVSSYKYIGAVYFDISEYSKALSYCEKALEIEQQSLPRNHPDLAASYNNIGSAYFIMGEYSKACSFYERAVNIAQQTLSINHPHRHMYEKALQIVKEKL